MSCVPFTWNDLPGSVRISCLPSCSYGRTVPAPLWGPTTPSHLHKNIALLQQVSSLAPGYQFFPFCWNISLTCYCSCHLRRKLHSSILIVLSYSSRLNPLQRLSLPLCLWSSSCQVARGHIAKPTNQSSGFIFISQQRWTQVIAVPSFTCFPALTQVGLLLPASLSSSQPSQCWGCSWSQPLSLFLWPLYTS